ncbi:hypothetical protein ACQ86G_01680 [Roseateles chitinivorans]|uniref:hypothetical protein n=1 Tax=Roseateles chitinivorans TaxID=2917965 RepID=UPI003D66658E
MHPILILLGFAVAAFLLVRLIRQARDAAADEQWTAWPLIRSLVAPLAIGIYLLVVTVRDLIRGEVACSGKGGCKVDTFLRTEHPEAYWVNLGLTALASALLLWVALRSYQRWRASTP